MLGRGLRRIYLHLTTTQLYCRPCSHRSRQTEAFLSLPDKNEEFQRSLRYWKLRNSEPSGERIFGISESKEMQAGRASVAGVTKNKSQKWKKIRNGAKDSKKSLQLHLIYSIRPSCMRSSELAAAFNIKYFHYISAGINTPHTKYIIYGGHLYFCGD